MKKQIMRDIEEEVTPHAEWLYADSVKKHSTAIVETYDVGINTTIWAFSHISKGAKIGKNCMIGEGVHIGNNVTIGDNCRIQNHSLIYEGVTLENNVFIGPNTTTTNDLYPNVNEDPRANSKLSKTLFKKNSSVGAGSVILAGVTLGENCLVACGSVVTKDVKPNVIYINGKQKER